jgi:ACS family D-galactonate transporter-like MFS transporter
MGAVAPIVTGFIVGVTGSFAGAFLVAGIALLIGIFAYVVLLGQIEPIGDLPGPQGRPATSGSSAI